MGERVTLCSVCKHPTSLACSDCRIDLQTTVYVCPTCRRHHDEVCGARLRSQFAAERDAAREDGAKAERERIAKVVADIAAKYCHIVAAGEVADGILAALASDGPLADSKDRRGR